MSVQRTEIRCDNQILFGIIDGRAVEVKCRSERCGARRGVVVLHRFSLHDGSLLETLEFKDPSISDASRMRKGAGYGAS